MVQETLEARIARLEEQMAILMSGRTDKEEPAADDWQQTVGMFRGDPLFQEMIDDSRKTREEDRRRARRSRRLGPT